MSTISTNNLLSSENGDNFSTKSSNKVRISEYNVELASHLIKDAAAGRLTHFERDPRSLKYYKVYLSLPFGIIRIAVHVSLLILLYFDFANRNADSVVSRVTVSLEIVAMVFYIVQLVIVFQYSTFKVFYRDKKYYISVLCILMTLVDIVLFMTQVYPIRISPALRVLLFVNSPEQHQIRRHLRTLRVTILNTMAISPFIITFYVMMFAFIYKFFGSKKIVYYDKKPYMRSFDEILWDTIVYITSANSPDVVLPGFAHNGAVGVLFLIFYGVFFFLLIFVYGLIMGKFRDNAKEEMQRLVVGKLSLCNDAFALLSSRQPDGSQGVSKETWCRMMTHIPKYCKKSKVAETLFHLLGDCEEYLSRDSFVYVGDLMSVPLSAVVDQLHVFEKYAWFYFSEKIAEFVESKFFNISIALLIIANLLVITFTSEQYTELLFCIIFIIEILLRIYVKGISRFFKSLWNIFDFCIIFFAFVFWFVNQHHSSNDGDATSQTVTFTLLILRNLRLLKLLRGITAYHQLLHILGMILPTLSSLLLIIFFFIIEYMCIGEWAYHGLFLDNRTTESYLSNCTTSSSSSSSQVQSEFNRLHYCILSFNSFLTAFVTMCSVAIGNNWHVIADGYGIQSGYKILSRIYFAVFKGAMTYLLLLIVAFVLDIFLLVYNQKGALQIEEKITKRIRQLNMQFDSYKSFREGRKSSVFDDNSESCHMFRRLKLVPSQKVYFRLKSKGARSVDYVSQAMFQAEIESEIRSSLIHKHLFNC